MVVVCVQEAQRLQPNGYPGSARTSSCARGLNLDPTDQSLTPKVPKEQGVILVMEHNAEVNAGYYGVPTMLRSFFFFLHCRTSARHGRSTTGISM